VKDRPDNPRRLLDEVLNERAIRVSKLDTHAVSNETVGYFSTRLERDVSFVGDATGEDQNAGWGGHD
jgi:hypothetical protein